MLFQNRLEIINCYALHRKRPHMASFTFHQSNNGPLLTPLGCRSAGIPLFLPTYPSFINFNDTPQLVNHWVLRHGKANPMEHEPGGAIRNFLAVERRGHPMELVRTHAFFARAHEMDSIKPFMKRNVAVLENAAHL